MRKSKKKKKRIRRNVIMRLVSIGESLNARYTSVHMYKSFFKFKRVLRINATNHLMMFWLIFALACVFSKSVFPYVLPDPTIEILKPSGLRVSIPDAPGLRIFGFHASVDEENNKYVDEPIDEKSGIYGYIFFKTNNRWIFEDRKVTIRNTDVLHYCIYALVKKVHYRKTQMWTHNKGWLLLGDNFNFLNASLWKREIKMPFIPDYEFCIYHNENYQQLVQINDGQLHIKPIIEADFHGEDMIMNGKLYLVNCTSKIANECSRQALYYNILPPVISARLTTKEHFVLRYGRIEIRAKFPQGDWLYPEMWLEPKHSTYGANYANGRVLLGMTRGNENLMNAMDVSKIYDMRRLDFGVRVGAFPNVREILVSKLHKFGPRWTQDFHVYTTIWTSDGFTFLVDDEEIGRVKPDEWLSDLNANRKNAPFDQEFYITLGVGAGGVRVFPDNTINFGLPKPWKNTGAKAMLNFWNSRNKWLPSWRQDNDEKTIFAIDYVKVWSY